MGENQLPEEGADVTAMTYASDEYDRPAREVRGKLERRKVESLNYIQCWIDGVQVDPASIKPA